MVWYVLDKIGIFLIDIYMGRILFIEKLEVKLEVIEEKDIW